MWPLNNFPQYGNPNGFTAPKPNSNFSNFNTAFAQVQPNAGTGIAATTNMPWMPNMPNMGFNPGPNMGFDPNAGYTPMPWQETKPDWYGGDYFAGLKTMTKAGDPKTDGGKDGYKPLSGSGSINGGTFKTGSGEIWTPAVKAGQTYNLLSDGGVGLNGTFVANSDGSEQVLGSIGLKVGDANITFSADGKLLVDGEEYNKSKNSLKGLVSEKDGTVTVKTNEGYTFTLKARGSEGVKVDIKAENVGADGIAPNGLWGHLFDGEKQTERELRKVKPRDFEIKDDLTFDYEDNNALTNQKTLDDDERGAQMWAGRNPKLDKVSLRIDDKFSYSADGKGIADWKMNALKADKPYLLFSEENLSVSGTFAGSANGASQELKSVALVIDGVARKVQLNAAGNIEVRDIDGNIVKVDGLKTRVTFPATNEDGESYNVVVSKESGRLVLNIEGKNVGANDTRSGGLLGDIVGTTAANGSDDNGAGYLRNEDGGISKSGSNMKLALREFELPDPFETESDRGSADVAEAMAAGETPDHTTYKDVKGSTWGDPHFVGADGELYDVMGKAGKIYNIVSDHGVQVNSMFGPWAANPNATVMKKLGFNLNGHQVEVSIDEDKRVLTYKLDGKELTAANMPSWISMADDKITINSEKQGEKWQFIVDLTKHKYGDHLDLTSKAITIDDHVQTTGIWGHSIGKNDLYKLEAGVYQAGGGGILRNADGSTLAFTEKEGSDAHTAALANYTETDLFSTASFWSQFNK